ncbi:MAG TPA: HNH endonuclease signature motif containing protein [Rhizobiaceae bacterium]|nr:HNH endonuclease signature motif containing protein [Rhizobiaceae bacterium]
MSRSVKEWVAKHDDAKIPPRVRDRIFTRDSGHCHWCKIAIKIPAESWQADHVVALINGGEHRETNLAPIHAHCHLEKTGIDSSTKSKLAKIRQAHRGIRPVSKMKGKPFDQSTRTLKNQERERLPALPPRAMFETREA